MVLSNERELELKAELLRRHEQERLWFYKPHAKQLAFHSAPQPFRIIAAGNQFGKTYAGVIDDIWTAGKIHPYRKNRIGQVFGRVCAPKFGTIKDVMIPYFRTMTPRYAGTINGRPYAGLWKEDWDKAFTWNQEEKFLHFGDGSFIEFKSYDQDMSAFAGSQRHFIHFDEDPTYEDLWGENLARQTTTGNDVRVTLTPVNYSPWLYETLYLGALSNPERFYMVTASSEENVYADLSAVQATNDFVSDENVRASRLHGHWVVVEGRVWKEYGEHNLCETPIIDDSWMKTFVLDPHDAKPSYGAWFVHNPHTDKHILYREAQMRGTFQEISDQVRSHCNGETIHVFLMDKKSGDQSSQLRGSGTKLQEFRKCGLPFLAAKPCDDVSRNAVRAWVSNNAGGGPKLLISKDCPVAHAQMRSYSFKKPNRSGEERKREEVVRKNDEAPACVMYYRTHAGIGYEVPRQSFGSIGMYGG